MAEFQWNVNFMKRIALWFVLIAFVCLVLEGISLAGLSIIEQRGNRIIKLSDKQKKTLVRFALGDIACFQSEEFMKFRLSYPNADELLASIKIVTGDSTCIPMEQIPNDLIIRLATAYDELIRHTRTVNFSPSLGWDTKPNYSKYNPYPATYNADGIRSEHEYNIPKLNGKTRIAAVGDSFTHGHGVSNTETWAHQLEELTKNTEVLNFGVGYYGLGQSYLKYKEKVKKYKPDIVLIGYYDTNLKRDVNRFRYFYNPRDSFIPTAPRFKLNEGGLVLIPNPVQHQKDYFKILEEKREFFDSMGRYDFYYSRFYFPDISDYSLTVRFVKKIFKTIWRKIHEMPIYKNGIYNTEAEPYKVVKAIFDAFYTEVADDKSVPIIVILPSRESLKLYRRQNMKAYQPLLDHFDAKNMKYIDVLEGFNKFGANSNISAFFRGHYSPYGNEIVAKTIQRELIRNAVVLPHRPYNKSH